MSESEIVRMIRLLTAVRDSPTLGESSNAVVVSGKVWVEINALLQKQRPR